MSKILVVKNGEGSRRTQMIEEVLREAGHEIVYEMPEPQPLTFIMDEYYNIPLTQPEKKATITPSTLIVKLIGRI